MKFVRIIVTFVLSLVVLFALFFVIANWGSLSSKIGYWWDSWRNTGRYGAQELQGFGQHSELIPPDDRLVIPALAINVPLIFPVSADHTTLLAELQNGVVHYPGTAVPGQIGNVFITGHSSQLVWEPGRYKSVFALLEKLAPEDIVLVYYQKHKYVYQVGESRVVSSRDTAVLEPTDQATLTLMTCWPVGTTARRLIVTAQLVDPEPVSSNDQPQADQTNQPGLEPPVLPAVR